MKRIEAYRGAGGAHGSAAKRRSARRGGGA